MLKFNVKVFLKLSAPLIAFLGSMFVIRLMAAIDLFSVTVYAMLFTGLIAVIESLWDCVGYLKLFVGVHRKKIDKEN